MSEKGAGINLLLYALGGGRGHLTRALALGRAAARRGHRATLVVNCWGADRVHEPGVRVEALSPELDRDGCAAAVQGLVGQGAWDALVVDTFPRGLGGELVGLVEALTCPRVWVHRDLTPAYVEARDLRGFARHYELVLVPGEEAPLADLPQAIRTEPWLVRDAHELLDRDAARRRLGVPAEASLAVVVGSGTRAELAEAKALVPRLDAALGDRGRAICVEDEWPLLELMAGVDLLVGAGGYNTVHEARATGTPLLGLARPRRYDRQARRLSAEEACRDEADLVQRAVEALTRRGPVTDYTNGVHTALEALEALLS